MKSFRLESFHILSYFHTHGIRSAENTSAQHINPVLKNVSTWAYFWGFAVPYFNRYVDSIIWFYGTSATLHWMNNLKLISARQGYSSFLMFWGGIERDQLHEMGKEPCPLSLMKLFCKKTAKSRKLFSQNKSIINFWWGSTIMVITFLDFLMFDQIFLSLTVKQSVVISNKHGIYELPHEFPNDLKSRILGN